MSGGFEAAVQDDSDRDIAVGVLRERLAYLDARVMAKNTVGWETTWDVRERNALGWALRQLDTKENLNA